MKGFWPRYPRCSIDVINTKCRPRTMTTSWLDADRVGGVIFSMPNQVGSPPIHPHADLPHYPQSNLRWSRDDKWMPKSQVILLQMPAQMAIVFVHGWGGSAGGTWEFFPKAVATL